MTEWEDHSDGDMLKSVYDPDNDGVIAVAQGGTGHDTPQEAIDELTQVSGATNEHVLTKDTATGSAIWKAASAGGADYTIDGGNATSCYTGTAIIDCGAA